MSEISKSVVVHFRQLGLEYRAGRPASLDDPFIGGLTYHQYFALSTAEQDAFWEKLFVELGEDMEAMAEVDICPHIK